MPTPKRDDELGLIGQLFAAPCQFDFFQAVRLLEQWLRARGVPGEDVLKERVRFRNSLALSFPASAIESLRVSGVGDCAGDSDPASLPAAAYRQLQDLCFHITPTFLGLLGIHGTLPLHYTERIATHVQQEGDNGVPAYFDLFSNRLVVLYYKAWFKYRLELAEGVPSLHRQLDLLLALVGETRAVKSRPVADEAAAFYAGAFHQRPCSPDMTERVLADYFDVAVKVEPQVGYWHPLELSAQATLGGENAILSERFILGPNTWRRDLRVRIWLGPLTKAQYDDFLPGAEGCLALKDMLSMFAAPTLSFEIRPILRAADVTQAVLTSVSDGPGARLGLDAFLGPLAGEQDRGELSYLIDML
ncbi:MAG TPA: type VI secretion system baseplate subunit TssG [Burkholderiaceae bacterium]|nr:type VI secretion system baseplate subunit TssG [Burkholderiaceae bacterium]